MEDKKNPTSGPPMSHSSPGSAYTPPPPSAPKPDTGPGGPAMSSIRTQQGASDSQGAFIATHTLKEGETLSHLAVKYYGNPSKPFWSLIYEANKETIGASERSVKPGMVLKIPKLPPALLSKVEIKK